MWSRPDAGLLLNLASWSHQQQHRQQSSASWKQVLMSQWLWSHWHQVVWWSFSSALLAPLLPPPHSPSRPVGSTCHTALPAPAHACTCCERPKEQHEISSGNFGQASDVLLSNAFQAACPFETCRSLSEALSMMDIMQQSVCRCSKLQVGCKCPSSEHTQGFQVSAFEFLEGETF